MTSRPLSLVTADGELIEAELSVAGAPRAAVVLCHPHPQYGGTMRSLVISELFAALPEAGITSLRFNFRSVGASSGTHDGGHGERLDAEAALHHLAECVEQPILLVGWSFGADVALSTRLEFVRGWVAIAPPLRFGKDLALTGADPRPKLLLLAEHDEFRDPDSVRVETADWTACTSEIVGGASHFFVGRTAALAQRVSEWILDVAAHSFGGDGVSRSSPRD